MSDAEIGSSVGVAVLAVSTFLASVTSAELLALVDREGERARPAAEQQERQHRDAGQDRHHQHYRRRHAERLRVARELLHQRLVGGARDAGLGDQEAGGGRHDQRRDLRHQSVADGEQRIGARRVAEGKPLLGDADDRPADDVDEHDEQAGDGVAAHEFRGAVHGAEEAGFIFELAAAAAGLDFVDHAGREIGIDRHLLAGHGVKVEARGDFRDAARALGDDHEVHDHQDREHDDADDEIAAHHEVAERLDHVAGGVGAFVPAREDEPGRGEVEREPQHGRDQQHGRERGEFERRLDEQRRHQDQDREDDRDRERHVEQRRRQRQDEDDQDRHHADGERDVAALEPATEITEARKGHPANAVHAVPFVRRSSGRAASRPVMGVKRLRGGREAARPNKGCRVHGPSPARFAKSAHPGKICPVCG